MAITMVTDIIQNLCQDHGGVIHQYETRQSDLDVLHHCVLAIFHSLSVDFSKLVTAIPMNELAAMLIGSFKIDMHIYVKQTHKAPLPD